jgi:hypothetical protein
MLAIIGGAILIIGPSIGFWYLLPRNGQVHPFVNALDGGSMITLAIMTLFTVGLVMMIAGFSG